MQRYKDVDETRLAMARGTVPRVVATGLFSP